MKSSAKNREAEVMRHGRYTLNTIILAASQVGGGSLFRIVLQRGRESHRIEKEHPGSNPMRNKTHSKCASLFEV